MPKTILTLRDPGNPNMPGEVKEFEHVGAVMGSQGGPLLTFFNDDPQNEDGSGGPRPFFAIASSLVYSIDTPEHNRPPLEAKPSLVIPRGRIQ